MIPAAMRGEKRNLYAPLYSYIGLKLIKELPPRRTHLVSLNVQLFDVVAPSLPQYNHFLPDMVVALTSVHLRSSGLEYK